MGCLPNTLFGHDVDFLFAYPTVKIVKIQDARLGLIRYFLTLLVACYIGVVQLWKEGGYLEFEKVSGVARFSLQQPTLNDCDPTDDNCLNQFSKLEVSGRAERASEPQTKLTPLHGAGPKLLQTVHWFSSLLR